VQQADVHVEPPWSAEARVLFRPASAYGELSPKAASTTVLLVRKPLLLAFVLGCAVAALASGRLSVRLIVDGAMSFAFVPAIELAAFATVYWTGRRRRIPFARALDLFFAGNAPWLLWIVVVLALGSVVPPRQISPWILPVLVASLIPIVWSAYIDFHFFREVMGRPARGAVRDLVIHRALGWVAATVYFLGIAIWSETLPELGAWMGL